MFRFLVDAMFFLFVKNTTKERTHSGHFAQEITLAGAGEVGRAPISQRVKKERLLSDPGL
jgi:hypothetical protein